MKLVRHYINEFYLPHYAILKTDSFTTKVQIVLNGSTRSASVISVNGTLLKDTVIQDELFEILLRFRTYTFVTMADGKEIYSQVKHS